MSDGPLPLHGIRVLELAGDKGALATRFLADLGADVVLLEHPDAAGPRSVGPLARGLSPYHEAFNANKRSVAFDPEPSSLRRALDHLLPNVDILFSSLEPRDLEALGLDFPELRDRHPHLVVGAFTHFGLTGPWRDWTGTEWVHQALGTGLSRSGAPGREPLMPPASMALQNASVQAAWAVLAAYAQRLVSGVGDLVDVSVHEAVLMVSDPPYGMAGSAAGGMPTVGGSRGREDFSVRYPFFRAADGWVRLAILSARQWAGMYDWLGRPAAFAGDAWAVLAHRYKHSDVLHPAIAELLASLPRRQVISQAARFGVPAASVLSPDEVMREGHFRARQAFVSRVSGGQPFLVPDGVVEVDGKRAGIRAPAPAFGQHTAEVLEEFSAGAVLRPPPGGGLGGASEAGGQRLPLDGVRVLDFGVIVAGGETGRLFADLGADVIKVENLAVPDGSRPALDGSEMNVLFAWGNRNKRSLGIDVKSHEGGRLIRELVRSADVLLSNFKPGTLEKLGLTFAQLSGINPRLVVLESSAFGHTGPWAVSLGYGPVVRAAVGLSSLWRYGEDSAEFFDDVTSYPDHASARVSATAALARLIGRRRTGRGGTVHLAQAEVFLWQHSHLFAGASLEPGSLTPVGNQPPGQLPRGVFAASGDDEWVVVDVRTSAQCGSLVKFLGSAAEAAGGADATRAEIETSLKTWLASVSPMDAMVALQERGIPAARMVRVEEVLQLPQVVARDTFRIERHPLVPRPMPSEGAPARFTNMPRVSVAPAPVVGQHTREIAGSLGLSATDIDALIRADVLQEDGPGLVKLAAAERAAGGSCNSNGSDRLRDD